MGYEHHINWLAGFLNHQQYQSVLSFRNFYLASLKWKKSKQTKTQHFLWKLNKKTTFAKRLWGQGIDLFLMSHHLFLIVKKTSKTVFFVSTILSEASRPHMLKKHVSMLLLISLFSSLCVFVIVLAVSQTKKHVPGSSKGCLMDDKGCL